MTSALFAFFDQHHVLGLTISTLALVVVYALAIRAAIKAVMHARTPQGATAWVLALIFMPFLALPLYWVIGRRKFDDYVDVLRDLNKTIEESIEEAACDELNSYMIDAEDVASFTHGEVLAVNRLAGRPITRGNHVSLLIDGDATFEAMFAAFDEAKSYILSQSYLIYDDKVGQRYLEHLRAARQRGVRVYVLVDAVGDWELTASFIDVLNDVGIEYGVFRGPKSWFKHFAINFRNHRKIAIIDGKVGFTGGLNIGNNYVGKSEREELCPWRDTHVTVQGPLVQKLQITFVQDWYYAEREIIEDLCWEPTTHADNLIAALVPSGPADELETAGFLYTHLIHAARKRVWIANPYFVPDARALSALQLAALRGVDVRVIIPRQSDSIAFRWMPYAYFEDIGKLGGKIFHMHPGFMHQKVMLVDDNIATVGSANFDNRSFRLNFEATVVVFDAQFGAQMADMFEQDFAQSTELTRDALESKSFWFRFAAKATQLLAPLL